MFARLFAESGLSLDRLRSLLEVAAAGSIVKAAEGDPVRQSQYSRQIKELEDFFRVKLIERFGKSMQLTSNGRELARISRFFLLGLSNFQRGCLGEEQAVRIGASATCIQKFLIPIISKAIDGEKNQYVLEVTTDDEVERRLHDLTLDFGVVTREELSRPLQVKEVGRAGLSVFVPMRLYSRRAESVKAFKEKRLPLVLATLEMDLAALPACKEFEAVVVCESFLMALDAMKRKSLAAVLPEFLAPQGRGKDYWRIPIPTLESHAYVFRLAWNPRLIRLNPRIAKTRDFLAEAICTEMRTKR